MYQLYKGDTPLATFVPKDASELPYSNGVSVKDKIDSVEAKVDSMFKYKTVTMNFGSNGRVALQNNTFTPDYTKIYNMYVKNESANYYILFTTYATGRYAQLMNADTGAIVPNKSFEVVICYSE